MDDKNKIDRLKEYWESSNKKTKTTVISSAVILLILVGSLTYLYNRDTYEFLLETTDKTSSANVINKLKEDGIKYNVKGDSIYVSGVNPDALKLELSGNGVLDTSSSNFEFFSKPMFISEKQEDTLLQKDLEQNISSAIKSYNEVADAKVILTKGKSSSFKNDSVPATAAIQLKLKSNLSAKQVKSIQEFVAAAVPNLSSSDVVITDTNNTLLSTNGSDLSIDDNVAYVKSMEDKISSQIADLLSGAFPSTGFKVVSRVDISFDQTKIESETVTSGPDTVVSHEKHNEITVNNKGNSVAGTGSNVPDTQNPTNKGQVVSEKNSEIINYELNKIKEQTTKQPQVKNINVAVIADQSLSAVDTEKIRDLVETASGYNEDRGDKVSVQGFENDVVDGDKSGFLTFVSNNFDSIFNKGLMLLIIVAALVVAIKLINAFKSPKALPSEDESPVEPTDDYYTTNIVEHKIPEPSKDSSEVTKKKEVLKSEMETNPQQVASVLQSWLDGK